jgi:PhzF family phenazine biosynthesis protein
MKLPLYQVDAFSRSAFAGNPAAVCPLDSWIYDATLQSIAAENNLSETAFFVPRDGEYHLRWFTPTVEVRLCGHATLASAWVVLHHLDPRRQAVSFFTQSGELRVARDGDRLVMSLPRRDPTIIAPPPALLAALGAPPRTVMASRAGENYLCIYDRGEEVARLQPDFAALAAVDDFGVCVTAPGDGFDCDFVSRYFAPRHGIAEDPVTGSAHCVSTPYWAERLGKPTLFARQISRRGGELWCRLEPGAVVVSGYVAPYFVGEIDV